MHPLSKFLLLSLLVIPTFNLSAQTTSSSLDTAFQTVLAKKVELTEKESFLKLVSTRVQMKIDTLLAQGKTSLVLNNFSANLKKTSVAFPLPKVSEVAALDASIRAGKITLQARASTATPMFYTGSIHDIFGGTTGTGLILDDYSQIDPLEIVILSGSTFQIVGMQLDHGNVVYQVTSVDYPYPTDSGYFIDARFVDAVWMPLSTLAPRAKNMPSKEVILSNLRASNGLPYIWGGNEPTGIPKLLSYYQPKGLVDENLRAKWMLAGVDCSGLLYKATEGSTPRNTSTIVKSGTGIEIAGKTSEEIIAQLKPLDVIAWKGHMLIVLDNNQVIQSKADYGTGTLGFQNGVKIAPLKEVLDGLLATRVALNSIDDPVAEGQKKMVIRRWYQN